MYVVRDVVTSARSVHMKVPRPDCENISVRILYRMSEIRRLRKTVGVTQAALADAAGTSQPTIAAYETGRKSPTLGTVKRLAESVGLAMSVNFHPPLTREDRRSHLAPSVDRATAGRAAQLGVEAGPRDSEEDASRQPRSPTVARRVGRTSEEVDSRVDPGTHRSRCARTRTPAGHAIRRSALGQGACNGVPSLRRGGEEEEAQ